MIVLDATTRSLELDLSGAVSTNQLPFVASYVDISQSTFGLSAVSSNAGQSNDTTAVTLVAAPGASTSRQIKYLSIRNEDTAVATVTVQLNDNSTLREIGKWLLAVDDTLVYTDVTGFYVLDSDGARKYSSDRNSDIAGLSRTDSNFIVGDGTDFVAESGATARTSLGLGTGDTPQFTGVNFGDENLTVYDEGTWTPVATFSTPGDLSVVYSIQTGSYVKIGRHVTASFFLSISTFTHTTATGSFTLTGLPFTVENVTDQRFIGALRWAGVTKANYTDIVTRATPNSSLLVLEASGSGQAAATIAVGDMPTGGTPLLIGTISYRAA